MRPESSAAGAPDRRTLWGEACAITALALLVRLFNLDHTTYVDELNHLIAAESLLRDGALLLESGFEYTRARLFTWLVAGSFLLFGESLPAARAPAVAGGTLLVTVAFLWVRTSFGRWEGWTAGILLLLAPQAIYHSQLARFYSFQALFVVAAAWCAWVLAGRPRWRAREGGVALLGLACAAGAMAMQISSLVGLGAIGGWLVVLLLVRIAREQSPVGSPRTVGVAMGVLILAAGTWLFLSGTWHEATAAFGQVGLWAESQEGNLRYYHYHLLSHYPLLWAPFPAMALWALHRRPRLISLWLAVFGTILVVHSIAGWKADRYIFYALPFFFMVSGVVVGSILRRLFVELRQASARVPGVLRTRAGGPLAAGLIVLSILFAAWGNPAFSYSGRMILGTDATWPFPVLYRGEADWRAVDQALRERSEASELLITSTEQKARYFLGRGEVILSANYLGRDSEGRPNPEFHPNNKTGLPVISRPETVEGVIDCHRSGLLLIEDNHWRREWSVPDDVADRIEALTRRMPLDSGWRIHGFEWDHGVDFEPTDPECHPFREPVPSPSMHSPF